MVKIVNKSKTWGRIKKNRLSVIVLIFIGILISLGIIVFSNFLTHNNISNNSEAAQRINLLNNKIIISTTSSKKKEYSRRDPSCTYFPAALGFFDQCKPKRPSAGKVGIYCFSAKDYGTYVCPKK